MCVCVRGRSTRFNTVLKVPLIIAGFFGWVLWFVLICKKKHPYPPPLATPPPATPPRTLSCPVSAQSSTRACCASVCLPLFLRFAVLLSLVMGLGFPFVFLFYTTVVCMQPSLCTWLAACSI